MTTGLDIFALSSIGKTVLDRCPLATQVGGAMVTWLPARHAHRAYARSTQAPRTLSEIATPRASTISSRMAEKLHCGCKWYISACARAEESHDIFLCLRRFSNAGNQYQKFRACDLRRSRVQVSTRVFGVERHFGDGRLSLNSLQEPAFTPLLPKATIP